MRARGQQVSHHKALVMTLRVDAFNRVMHLSQQQTDKFTTGSLITRLTNDITVPAEFSKYDPAYVCACANVLGSLLFTLR